MKKPCCTDIIGARHIEDYDVLFHFGYACFSEEFNGKHHYILPELQGWDSMESDLLD